MAPTGKRRQLDTKLRWSYGITVRQYEAMLTRQGQACAICKKVPEGKRLGVDHDHDTGAIRGLLCMRCNLDLGYYEKLMGQASLYQHYLDTHP